jgi:predicted GNAT family acetyltransferase
MNLVSEYNRVYANDDTGRLIAEVTFPPAGVGLVEINHTFVDESLRGEGAAGRLMNAAYERIKADGKKAKVTCSYAAKWFAGNADKRDILITPI